MGDKQDGLAFCRQIPHDLHQFFDFLRRQHSSRFVENQDLVVTIEHFQDLSTLLHTNCYVFDYGIGIHHQTIFLTEGQHLVACFLLLQQAVFGGFDAHNDIIQD